MNPHPFRSVATTTIAVIAGAFVLMLPRAARAQQGDACALLTTAQVQGFLGVPVDPGVPILPTNHQFCTWSEHGKPAGTASNVMVGLISARQFEGAKTVPPGRGMTSTPVSGIGDEAYHLTTPGAAAILYVRKGASYFQVRARTNGGLAAKGQTAASDARDATVARAVALEILKKI
jgi:hypothetical protein